MDTILIKQLYTLQIILYRGWKKHRVHAVQLDAERPLLRGGGRMEKAKKENWIISIINDKWGKCGKTVYDLIHGKHKIVSS